MLSLVDVNLRVTSPMATFKVFHFLQRGRFDAAAGVYYCDARPAAGAAVKGTASRATGFLGDVNAVVLQPLVEQRLPTV